MAASNTQRMRMGLAIPRLYRVFFLGIEPVSALIGAYYAHVRPDDYLHLTHAVSKPDVIPQGTSIVLSQLANLYLFFALNEALVLRSTSDLRVWKTVLFVLLVADMGHLYTVRSLGPEVYYNLFKWNAIDWGNVPFVYLGASMRVAFLAGVGLTRRRKLADKQQ
ncbi:hypothetical protein CH063_05356 [Colletotrichum higginsianum]|uniref:Nadp-dependent alcohol dehydrogenase-like protein n=2 Tax=Colletotrichum higginsianum TaxID=80884 RepID=H1UYP8_COLHI|nr:Nadp-dependent alcohol dehydrogenase-like protein [Colletotrichum higginsianum IMI 349063]OBR14738.1 Nadp-dependent alcohol dehydrogenase-like protein [Colletotrichum higginsianum IMI 349063]TID02526.1 hypothetical protein CH35J_004828 [Colletotrichum higginsianum]GJD05260.1 NADP-dependent alcohol dehydrogenase-like protein [Colletotrichum higginsianum]CCF33099.1 hypothetical protein CH063_05356 [Colletotrichum higginsianum]